MTVPRDPGAFARPASGRADGDAGSPLSFLLLAGGESRRMGRDKARIRLPAAAGADDRTLLGRTLEVGAEVTRDLILAPGDPGRYRGLLEELGWERGESRADGSGVSRSGTPPETLYRRGGARLRVVPDREPGAGPLAGLAAGLAAAERDPVFVAACDLPFLDPAPVRALAALLQGVEPGTPAAAVPELEGRLHPLSAACTRAVGSVAAACLAEGEGSVLGLVDRIAVIRVPGAELERVCGAPAGSAARWTTNLNRPEQLATLEEART